MTPPNESGESSRCWFERLRNVSSRLRCLLSERTSRLGGGLLVRLLFRSPAPFRPYDTAVSSGLGDRRTSIRVISSLVSKSRLRRLPLFSSAPFSTLREELPSVFIRDPTLASVLIFTKPPAAPPDDVFKCLLR
uniref:Uncharacterized protein n=1 Tax=Cacopsylla melanoneura TaxID=428564 RepID=A0A8D9AP08_9HEMI